MEHSGKYDTTSVPGGPPTSGTDLYQHDSLLKGGRGLRGIELVGVILKMIITSINTRLKVVISIHGFLHGFRQCRGMGTATLEAKLAQYLAVICYEPLFQVLLDVKKA